MANHRVARLGGELKRELAAILDREVKDPRLGLVSVVAVDIAPDGCAAHVYISPLTSEHSAADVGAALCSASGYIRRELGARLKLRKVPELRFVADDSIEIRANISRIVNSFDKKEEEVADDE